MDNSSIEPEPIQIAEVSLAPLEDDPDTTKL
jgi:hypothetical protein